MKHEVNLVLVVSLLAVAIPVAHAAKPAKAANKDQKNNAAVIKKYDKNGNGFIDADEVEAIQKAFKADPDLKRFDTNGDGKLDGAEVSAINPMPRKKKK
jgi:Ca2+-binding EF-hand superfamily protein